MRVLMISGDKKILQPGSAPANRLALQRSAVEALDVYVWPRPHGALAIIRAARRGYYDVITTQDPFWRGLVGFLAARASRASRARLNLQVHTDLSGQSWLRRALAGILLHRADSVRVVSQRARRALPPNLSARISVLPLYLTIEPFERIRRMRAPYARTLLWMGRFEPEKDPLLALRVFADVHKTEPDARLIMLGEGSLLARLWERARELGIEPFVEFPGWQDPKAYLSYADVVFSTSRHESWGASLIEALAARVPTVAPDVGIAREAGAIVVSRERIAEAIIDVLQSGAEGKLQLPLLTDAPAWASAWRATL